MLVTSHDKTSLMSPKSQTLLVGALLVVAGCLSYCRVLNAGFIWDDDAYVTANPTLRTAGGLWEIWTRPGATPQYYPAVHTTFWMEFQLWGENARGYHFVNVILHLLTSIILGSILIRLGIRIAWPAAFLFALHPIQVESVAWITERKNVLSGLFYCLSALAMLQWRFPASPRTSYTTAVRSLPSPILYWAAFALFLLALLSKTTTCVLPAVALVVIWWKTGQVNQKDVATFIPFFVCGIAFGLMTAWMEKWRVGAVGEEFSLNWLQRCLVATHALCFYIWKAVLPRNLTFIYPRWDFNSLNGWQIGAPILCVFATIVLLQLARRGQRGPLAAGMLYAGCLFPALGFFNVYPMRYSFVADHFSYLSMMPLLTGVAWLVFEFAANKVRAFQDSSAAAVSQNSSPLPQKVVPLQISCLVIAAVCIPLTFMQTGMYRDLETLWRTTLERNPTAWMAHHNLGKLLEEKSEPQEALEHYLSAIELNPNHVQAMNNAGLLQIKAGQFADAEALLRKAIERESRFDLAHNNLAIALVRQGRLEEALAEFDLAIAINPKYENARINRAAVINALQANK